MIRIPRLLKRIYYRIITFMITRNYKRSKLIDDWFREQLKNPEFSFDSIQRKNTAIRNQENFTILLNGYEIWITNKYYASPTVTDETVSNELPYMDTTIDFFKKYEKFLESIKLEQPEALKNLKKVKGVK